MFKLETVFAELIQDFRKTVLVREKCEPVHKKGIYHFLII